MDFNFLRDPFRLSMKMKTGEEIKGSGLHKQFESMNIKSFKPIARKKGGSLAKSNNIRMIF